MEIKFNGPPAYSIICNFTLRVRKNLDSRSEAGMTRVNIFYVE